jgi:hypothetical protein
MPNSIYRITLGIVDNQVLSLSGPPISVAAARDGSGRIDAWYEHTTGASREYTFRIVGTGFSTPWSNTMERMQFRFLGTVILHNDEEWHVYLHLPEVAQAWQQSMKAVGVDES